MAALTLSSSKRFIKSLNQTAFQDVKNVDFDGERIYVRTPSAALATLKAHGWTRMRKYGRANLVVRSDGTWPLLVHRDSTGSIAVEPPVVDSLKDFKKLAVAQTPDDKLRDAVRVWTRIQQNEGYNLTVEWMDQTNPRFDPEFLHAPGIVVTTSPPAKLPVVKMRQLKDAAALLGYDPVGYLDINSGLTYCDLYFPTSKR